jgi:phage major head subunit gpT-like protein
MANTTQSTNLDIKASLKVRNTTFQRLLGDLFVPQSSDTGAIYGAKVTGAGLSLQNDMLGPVPTLQKRVGPRIEKFLRAYKQTIDIETYETSLWIDRKTYVYDDSGLIEDRMRGFVAANANTFYSSNTMATILANGKCYDGVSLLSASHPHASGGATWSNYGTSALNRANYQTAVVAGLSLTLENGLPANVNYTHMAVGALNRDCARRLLQADDRVEVLDHQGKPVTEMGTGFAAVTNIYRGELDLIVDPYITASAYPYAWFLIDASKGQAKPVIIMESMPPQLTQRQDPEDPRVWSADEFGWGLLTDTAFAPGAPQTIYGSLATAGGY